MRGAGGWEGGLPLFYGWFRKVTLDKVTFEQRSQEERESGAWRSVRRNFQIKRTVKAEVLSGRCLQEGRGWSRAVRGGRS